MVINRCDIYLVSLAPTIGAETRKTRPCVVVSPDEMNRHVRTVVVAPLTSMTSKSRGYPTRVPCRFKGKAGQVVLDQIRTVDGSRLVRRLGRLDRKACESVLDVVREMFAP